jgi:hypothetical protein
MSMSQVSPHADRLERWLGAHEVHNLSVNFRDWYGPPVAVGGVPGSVFVTKGGDFIGECRAGAELSGVERAMEIVKEEQRRRFKRFVHSKKQRGSFGSLSALITAATAGKQCRMTFSKVGTAPTAIAGAIDLWMGTGQPAAGSAGAAAPTGTSPTNSTTGSMPFVNAVVNANTSHFVNAWITANFANSLLLYDRLLAVAKTMNSTATESVTGTFSRYQDATSTAADYIGGNFVYPAVTGTLLPATAHNWTVCQYTSQGGTTGQSIPSMAGISSCAINQIDLLLGNWFMPLASGDVGVKALTQMQCSALVATGTVNFVVGHPIACIPVPLVNIACNFDAVASAFNLINVYDNACLGLIELPKPATNATTYNGILATVSE